MQFQMTPTEAKLSIDESTRMPVSRTLMPQAHCTLLVDGNVNKPDFLNLTAEYLAKTDIAEVLK